jgi:short-subunit dehydrogenase
VESFGGALDGVVLCYAILTSQEQASADPTLARQVIEVNFTSPVILLNAAAAYMAPRQRGYLCVLSSVAGDRGRPSNYLYGASKAALTAYLDGLRARLHSAGVDVITVKPGPVDTAMTWGRERLVLAASPERVAAAACRAIRRHRGTIYTPWFWRPIMALVRAIPEPIFKRMKL